MARNEEKSKSMYNKWQTLKKEQHGELGVTSARRPHLAQMCKSLGEAEKWRRELVNDITRKISQIQNASLGEAQIRELNDDINKLMRTKHQWNLRIRELGGPDYRAAKLAMDIEGKELPGESGGGGAYRYYGAAKDLPGIREKFEEHAKLLMETDKHSKKKRSLHDIAKNLKPDYFGFGEKDDPKLLAKERAREREAQQAAIAEFKMKKAKLEAELEQTGGVFGGGGASVALAQLADDKDDDGDEIDAAALDQYEVNAAGAINNMSSYVALPDESDLARLVVEEKKKQMLASFL